MELLPVLMLGGGAFLVLALMVLAFSGPNAARASARRLTGLRERHAGGAGAVAMEAQIRRVTAKSASGMDLAASRFMPNPALLQKRLNMTGKNWTLSQYGMITLGLIVVPGALLYLNGVPIWLALFLSLFLGVGL